MFHLIDVSSTWCCINLMFHQLDVASTWCFINLMFHQLGVSSTWCFIDLMFHQLDVSSTWCFIKLVFHQLGVLSTWCCINLVFYQLDVSSTWCFNKCLPIWHLFNQHKTVFYDRRGIKYFKRWKLVWLDESSSMLILVFGRWAPLRPFWRNVTLTKCRSSCFRS